MTESLHLDYATRDYDGFRRLLISVIDRQNTAWSERAAADLGIMVVELLAYELDRLAYAGDRVAEEGFLATARRRESARRHAALGDHELDRGNVTRGVQWFQLLPDQTRTLPARTAVEGPIDPRDPDATPLRAETLDVARLDARRNGFVLAQAAPAGTKVLRLQRDPHDPCRITSREAPRHLDLREIGFAAGMLLIVGTPIAPGPMVAMPGEPPLQLALGEIVRIARVMQYGVELEHALQYTWPGGDDGAWVLGNVVEVRRGRTSEWTAIGRGGAALGELSAEQFLQLRMETVRRLRAEAEDARAAWSHRPELVRQWTTACRAVSELRRQLGREDLASYDLRVADARKKIGAFDAVLVGAAGQLRNLLVAIGRNVPDDLDVTDRVPWPRQRIELQQLDQSQQEQPQPEQPVLWMDSDRVQPERTETLAVAVGVAGAWTRWTEQPDLLRSAPDDHHYVVEIDGNSRITLRFGDGVTGAMLPAGCQVMSRWVTGDESGEDIRAGALSACPLVDASGIVTSNPLPTTGGRAPERLDGLAARVELGLELPAIPVTADDYHVLLERRDGIVESAVNVAQDAVDIVIRPAVGVAAGQLLDDTRAWLDDHRLAGTTVGVRLPRPLPIDIGLVVDVHPDVSAADLRYRVQRSLVAAFGDAQPEALGRARDRAEVYGVVEGIAGILWSQVVVFDLAGNSPAGVHEAIRPAADEIVRCGGVDEQPADGRVLIWAARRYALQLTVRYDSLDVRRDLAAISQVLPALLSGPASLPAQRGWKLMTPRTIDDALAGAFAGAGFTVTVNRLIVDRRAVEQVEIGERELPILETATLVESNEEGAA